mmetsp:Transcript_22541/g.85416  ORF Transcript_22541/g.85416 Transcript_22541/m.85416 type:complete len:233 (+) Transcript_22541:684-1382(+)
MLMDDPPSVGRPIPLGLMELPMGRIGAPAAWCSASTAATCSFDSGRYDRPARADSVPDQLTIRSGPVHPTGAPAGRSRQAASSRSAARPSGVRGTRARGHGATEDSLAGVWPAAGRRSDRSTPRVPHRRAFCSRRRFDSAAKSGAAPSGAAARPPITPHAPGALAWGAVRASSSAAAHCAVAAASAEPATAIAPSQRELSPLPDRCARARSADTPLMAAAVESGLAMVSPGG